MSVFAKLARTIRWETRLLVDRLGDLYYSIHTVQNGQMPLTDEESIYGDAYVNGPVSYWILKYYLDWQRLNPNEIFFDVGCGDGRVLCMVARRKVRKCVGIELSRNFADKAIENAKNLRARVSPIEVRVGDAAVMDYSESTILYFGNPFGADTMKAVLNQLRKSVIAVPRSVLCIVILPVEQRLDPVREALKSTAWLNLSRTKRFPGSALEAEYWEWNPSREAQALAHFK
jgi:SAM-dependent methyltransferase